MRTDQTARLRPSRPVRLDPVRRLRPGRGSLLRLSLVAALLLTAAAALYARDVPSTDGVAGPPAGPQPAAADSALPGTAPPELAQPVAAPPGAGQEAGFARRPVPPGLVGVPVPLADPAPLAVLRPGDRVDLLGVPTTGGATTTYGAGVEVLALDPAGAALFLAFPEAQAYEVVAAAPTVRFVVIVRPDG